MKCRNIFLSLSIFFGTAYANHETCSIYEGSGCNGKRIYQIYWQGYDKDGRLRRCGELAAKGICTKSAYNAWKKSHDSRKYDPEGYLHSKSYYRMTGEDGDTFVLMKGVSGTVCFSDSSSNSDDRMVAPLNNGMPCGEEMDVSQNCPTGMLPDDGGGCMPAPFADDKCYEDPSKALSELDNLITQTEMFDSGLSTDTGGEIEELEQNYVAENPTLPEVPSVAPPSVAAAGGEMGPFGGIPSMPSSKGGSSASKKSSGTAAGGVSIGGVSASENANEAVSQKAVTSGSDATGKMTSGGGSTATAAKDSMVDTMLSIIGAGLSGDQNGEAIGFGKSGEYDQQGRKISSSGETLKIQDPDDYFTRVDMNESIFKVVEKRYRKTQSGWVLKGAL